jgi:hypothetical protein
MRSKKVIEYFIKMQKKDKTHCQNCGCDSHCGVSCNRTEKHYPLDGGKEYEIEVCKQCRCQSCT